MSDGSLSVQHGGPWARRGAGVRLTVAGVGSRVRGDDAIGLHLVQRLVAVEPLRLALWEDADALAVAHQMLALTGPVLIVDCAEMGLAPGEYRVFGETEIPLMTSVSTHGFGLAEALGLARALGFTQAVTFFGVQPERTDLAGELSAVLRERFDRLHEALVHTVAELADG